MYGINIDKQKCVHCNKCISVCPTNLANICKSLDNGSTYIEIDKTKCINCGECIKACTEHKARYYEDDIDLFFNDISAHKDLVLIVAPSIRVSFPQNWRNVIAWIRSLNIKAIYDVSFGADICTWAHVQLIRKNKNLKLITQPCAAITDYITKYHTELIEHLSPVYSPMLCLAAYIKKYLKCDTPIAALSPCIAKKTEFEESGLVKYNVTFGKIKEYIQKHNIDIEKYKPDNDDKLFDSYESFDGVLYPVPGGLKDNLLKHVPNLKILNCEGHNKIYSALNLYTKTPNENLPDVFDVLGCEYGCNSGPGIGCEPDIFSFYSYKNSEYQILSEKQKKHSRFNGDKQFKYFNRNLKLQDFLTEYKNKNITIQEPDEKEYNKIYEMLYKDTEEKKNFNCGACGYKTCRQMVRAVALGYTTIDNCFEKAKTDIALQSQKINHINNEISEIVSTMNSVVTELVKTIESATNSITNINTHNDRNAQDLNDIGESINELNNMSGRIKNAISIINQYSENNDKMSRNLLDIARQTNILAINASIEASRAKNGSNGFSVISNEIRALAGKSKDTVENSNKLSSELLNTTELIIELISNIDGTLENIFHTVMNTSDNINKTKNESNDILISMEQISSIANNVKQLAVKTTNILKTTTK